MVQKVIRLLPEGNPETGMGPSDLVAAADFTTPDKTEQIHDFFAAKDAGLSVGVWKCAPCREEIEAYPVHEMMTVISGGLTLTNADGSAEHFRSGDTFFIAKGTKLVWEITETLTKYYMIVE